MFFKEDEMLTFSGDGLHRDYVRYNEIAKNMDASKLGELSVDGFYRMGERRATSSPRSLELSLWRVTDKNVSAPERGVDTSKFVLTKPSRERVSYIVVPRMNTDRADFRPCEYTTSKDATFEDINDPRVIVIARSYKGMVAEIAKDLVIKNEKEIRDNYRYLADEYAEKYCPFSNSQLLTAITGQALQMFDQNAYQTFVESSRQSSSSTFYAYVDPLASLVKGAEDSQIINQSEAVDETNFSEKEAGDSTVNERASSVPNDDQLEAENISSLINRENKIISILSQNAIPEPAFIDDTAIDLEQ